jgi:hypothetical protein
MLTCLGLLDVLSQPQGKVPSESSNSKTECAVFMRPRLSAGIVALLAQTERDTARKAVIVLPTPQNG